MATEYKGFNITVQCDPIVAGAPLPQQRYFIKGEGFNTNGYATLNNAKGAITKHLNVEAAKQGSPELQQAFDVLLPKAKTASCDDTDKASLPAPATLAQQFGFPQILPEESQPLGYTHPAVTWPFETTLQAFRDEVQQVHEQWQRENLPVARPSRNKREGRYVGITNGRHDRAPCQAVFSLSDAYYMPNRKARKDAKMEVRNSACQGAFGGHIKQHNDF